jgi:hypothetical protein
VQLLELANSDRDGWGAAAAVAVHAWWEEQYCTLVVRDAAPCDRAVRALQAPACGHHLTVSMECMKTIKLDWGLRSQWLFMPSGRSQYRLLAVP